MFINKLLYGVKVLFINYSELRASVFGGTDSVTPKTEQLSAMFCICPSKIYLSFSK